MECYTARAASGSWLELPDVGSHHPDTIQDGSTLRVDSSNVAHWHFISSMVGSVAATSTPVLRGHSDPAISIVARARVCQASTCDLGAWEEIDLEKAIQGFRHPSVVCHAREEFLREYVFNLLPDCISSLTFSVGGDASLLACQQLKDHARYPSFPQSTGGQTGGVRHQLKVWSFGLWPSSVLSVFHFSESTHRRGLVENVPC